MYVIIMSWGPVSQSQVVPCNVLYQEVACSACSPGTSFTCTFLWGIITCICSVQIFKDSGLFLTAS